MLAIEDVGSEDMVFFLRFSKIVVDMILSKSLHGEDIYTTFFGQLKYLNPYLVISLVFTIVC